MIQLVGDESTPIYVLDHGYIDFIEDWGHGKSQEREAGIIEAARMSTNKGFNGWELDRGLLTFLYTHRHMTPFEMAGMTIEVMAPIFVYREWHRHRTQSYNEMSGRYIPLPDYNYVPAPENLLERCEAAANDPNKQAKGTSIIVPSKSDISFWLGNLTAAYNHAQVCYENGLRLGIVKECARLPVPVARYSKMRASANLRNWLAFLTLRMDPAAQWEIRQFANAVGTIISKQFPETWRLFRNEFK